MRAELAEPGVLQGLTFESCIVPEEKEEGGPGLRTQKDEYSRSYMAHTFCALQFHLT